MASREPKPHRSPIGAGPYRSGPDPTPLPDSGPFWTRFFVSVLVLMGLGVWGLAQLRTPRTLDSQDVPQRLLAPLESFPPPETPLLRAVPLEPLMAADQPDAPALLSPEPGALRLRPGQRLRLRFNHPMVPRHAVGELATGPVVRFSPPVQGTTRWLSRSRAEFMAAPGTWSRTREVHLHLAPELRTLADDEVNDIHERVVIFDATPTLQTSSSQRVAAGAPLPLYFDNPVDARDLGRELFAYELRGGNRAMPIVLRSRGQQGPQRYRIDLLPQRRLEAGSTIAVAIAPRWTSWGGSSPSIVRYNLQPRPQIEGVHCRPGTTNGNARNACSYGRTPGQVVSIEESLRVMSSAALNPDSVATAVRLVPPLPGMTVNLEANGKTIAITGPWAADEVYTVRIGALKTTSGETLLPTPPLAVRSSGHTPVARFLQSSGNRLAQESGAPNTLHLRGINIGESQLHVASLDSDEALLAAVLNPQHVSRHPENLEVTNTPLTAVLPEARPNRWDESAWQWKDDQGPGAALLWLTHGADPATNATLLQQSNLSPTVRVLPGGIAVWLTRLDTGAPVAGAELTLRSRTNTPMPQGTTDRTGFAWLPTPEDLVDLNIALLATHEGDRAAVALTGGHRLGPEQLGLPRHASNRGSQSDDLVAAAFTDRGIYRPGETLHVQGVVRRLQAGHFQAAEGNCQLTLQSATGRVVGNQSSPLSPSGSLSGTFQLPPNAPLGGYTVFVTQGDNVIGQTALTVSTFRQPRFRVDLEVPVSLRSGDAFEATTTASYLFGAQLRDSQVQWSLVRDGALPYPRRFRQYRFGALEARAGHGALHTAQEALAEEGATALAMERLVEGNRRQRLLLETTVTDSTGQSVSRSRRIPLFPAAEEVGLGRLEQWQSMNEPLRPVAIVIDNDDEPVVGREVQVRFYREGWHSWWEWHQRNYHSRREHERVEVGACSVTSGAPSEDAATCEFLPERSGTYVVEATIEDAQGRRSVAAQRLYVAGPNEHPDRDPPGTEIAFTPTRAEYAIGETAEFVFESPWDDAHALVTIEANGQLLDRQMHQVSRGAQPITVALTEAMVPQATVAVTLVRGRQGAPGDNHDVLAPDLRWGVASAIVRPELRSYEVSLSHPDDAPVGTEIPIEVEVRHDGAPARDAEVSLWLVDEATLRLSAYAMPEPLEGMTPEQRHRFAWEDLRRDLLSRLAPPTWRGGGDGGEAPGPRQLRPEDEILNPTPLWLAHAPLDENGRLRTNVRLPDRATEYRLFALVLDDAMGTGSAEGQIAATRDLVLQVVAPRFATEGDEVATSALIHNTSGRPLEGTFRFRRGEAQDSEAFAIAAGQTLRIDRRLTVAAGVARVPLGLEVEVPGAPPITFERTLPIAPAGRWRRAQGIGSVRGPAVESNAQNRPIALDFGPVQRGYFSLRVSSHPQFGFRSMLRSLHDSMRRDVATRASSLLLTSMVLEANTPAEANNPFDLPLATLRHHARQDADALLRALQEDGSLRQHRYMASSEATVLAMLALHRAEDLSLAPEGTAGRLAQGLRRRLGSSNAPATPDFQALALWALHEVGLPDGERNAALFGVRELLGPGALAHLAGTMDPVDPRRQTLIAEATHALTRQRTDENGIKRASLQGAPKDLAALLQVALGEHPELTTELVATLLNGRRHALTDEADFGWGNWADQVLIAYAMHRYRAGFTAATDFPVTVRLGDRALEAHPEDPHRFILPASALASPTSLSIEGPEDLPVFFTLDADWAVPGASSIPEGRGLNLHRRYERQDGSPVGPEDSVAPGEVIRVRLFVYNEHYTDERFVLHDPIPAGFAAIDTNQPSSPTDAVRALLGMAPEDDAGDPRGHYALRSVQYVVHRSFEANLTQHHLHGLPRGLQEYTYALRATSPGRFVAAPAQLEAQTPDPQRDSVRIARSASHVLQVAGR